MTPNPETAREDPSRPGEPLTTAALAGAGDSRGREERSFEADADHEREDVSTPMFPAEEAQELRSAWDSIQAGFVDEPRSAVESADELVARTMKRLAEGFAAERAALEEQWASGGDVSTEDLRQALRRYRAFFGRLLSV